MRTTVTLAWPLLALAACNGEKQDGTDGPATPTDPTPTPTTDTEPPPTDTATTAPPTDTATTDTTEEPQPGDPLTVDVTNWVYAVDLGAGNWTKPAGLGALIASSLGDTELLVTPTYFDATTVDLLGAIGAIGVQDPCVESVAFPDAAWTDPSFSALAPAMDLSLAGVAVSATDVTLSAMFKSDGTLLGQGEFAANVDTRTLGYALGVGDAENAVCLLVATFGVSCVPCPDGAEYCLEVEVIDLTAPQVVGGAVVERTTEDIAADPYCY